MKPLHFSNKGCYRFALLIIILLIISCKKDMSVIKKSTDKNIVSVNILKADSTSFDSGDVSVIIIGDSIKITLPGTTDVSNLIPEFKTDGGTVSPVSGRRQNFTNPIMYTITAEDGTTKNYVVVVQLDKLKNIVYFGGQDGYFYALDTKKGTLLWKYLSGGNFAYSAPTMANGLIYAGSVDGNMYALDPAYGKVRWAYKTNNAILPGPVVANGIVYFGSDDTYIYAVDALTGNLKWKYKTGLIVDSSPAVANGVLYIGSADGNLYALDAVTGLLKWRYNTYGVIVEASVLVSNGVVFIGDRNGYLNAITAATGQLKWRFNTGGISMEQSRPIVQNGVIYVASWYYFASSNLPGSLYAIDENSGNLIWKSLDNKGFTSGPAFSGGKLYINADDVNTYALDAASGSIIWKKSTLSNGCIPTIAEGNVYPGGGGNRFFYSLNANTGDENWKFPLPNSGTTSKPLVIDSTGNVVQ